MRGKTEDLGNERDDEDLGNEGKREDQGKEREDGGFRK